MREILFRGKRIDNGEWAEGLPSYDENGNLAEIEVYRGFCNCNICEIDLGTVCQYTGLTDRNGRKIFEGDIVRLPKCENDIAVFSLKGCNYFLKGKCSDYEIENCDGEYFEVIGNIFDNPDLCE